MHQYCVPACNSDGRSGTEPILLDIVCVAGARRRCQTVSASAGPTNEVVGGGEEQNTTRTHAHAHARTQLSFALFGGLRSLAPASLSHPPYVPPLPFHHFHLYPHLPPPTFHLSLSLLAAPMRCFPLRHCNSCSPATMGRITGQCSLPRLLRLLKNAPALPARHPVRRLWNLTAAAASVGAVPLISKLHDADACQIY